MSSTNFSSPIYPVTGTTVDRTEMESGLWLFLSAPASFVLTLLTIVIMAHASF